MQDDQALLDAYVSRGSSAAFTRLVERHTNLVYSVALRRVGGDPHRARDVSQRVFADLARKAPGLVRHPLLAGWLHQSTRWAAQNERRAEQRRWRAEQAAAEEAMVLAGGVSAAEWDGVREVLDEALDALRAADRDAILMRFFQGLSYAEMAGQAGGTENAMRMRVERALDRVQVILHRKGITSTVVALGGMLAQNAVAATAPGLAEGFAAQALAAPAAGATGAAGLWLSSTVAHLPLVLVTVIAGVLTWGLLDARTGMARDRAEVEARAVRRAEAARVVEQLEQSRLREASRAVRPPAPAATVEPTAVQLERRRLDLLIRKGELDRTHAGLFRQLRLSPERVDRLKELIVDRNQAVYDALQLAKVEGVTLDYPERRQLERESAAPLDRQIEVLLGADAVVARRFLDTFEYRRELRLTGTDLSPGDLQRAPEIEAWAAAAGSQLDALLAARERSPGYVPLPDVLEAGLRQLLTPAEITERERYLEMDRVLARMNEIAREAAYAGKLTLSPRFQREYASRAGAAKP